MTGALTDDEIGFMKHDNGGTALEKRAADEILLLRALLAEAKAGQAGWRKQAQEFESCVTGLNEWVVEWKRRAEKAERALAEAQAKQCKHLTTDKPEPDIEELKAALTHERERADQIKREAKADACDEAASMVRLSEIPGISTTRRDLALRLNSMADALRSATPPEGEKA